MAKKEGLLDRRENESELDYYNRIAFALLKILIKQKKDHQKTPEEFRKEIDIFNEEWQEAINRDPLIGTDKGAV